VTHTANDLRINIDEIMELNTRIPRDVKKTCFVDEWFQSNKLKKKVVNSLLQGNYCKIFGNTKISNENFLKILK